MELDYIATSTFAELVSVGINMLQEQKSCFNQLRDISVSASILNNGIEADRLHCLTTVDWFQISADN